MVSWSWEDMAFQITVTTVSVTVSGIITPIVLKFLNDYISNKKNMDQVLVQGQGPGLMYF
jgi:hypothetical protein